MSLNKELMLLKIKHPTIHKNTFRRITLLNCYFDIKIIEVLSNNNVCCRVKDCWFGVASKKIYFRFVINIGNEIKMTSSIKEAIKLINSESRTS